MTGPPAVENKSTSDRLRRPKASICIPAFQVERYLQATIDSVLAQDIVIVDNNSSDGTHDILEMVKDDRVRVMRNATTLPIVDNWNLAVQQCHGQYVKLLCADDTLRPECIAAQIKVLEDNPDVALVSARNDFVDEDGELLSPARGLYGIVGRHPAGRVVRQIVRSGINPIGAPVAVMFRRVDFDRCGGFRADLPFVMDLDLWVRLLHNGDFLGLPRSLGSFRIRSESITALTSAHSQRGDQIQFARRLVDDPHWKISVDDRIVGEVNCYIKQVLRTAIYLVSTLRASRRRRRANNPNTLDSPLNGSEPPATGRSEAITRILNKRARTAR